MIIGGEYKMKTKSDFLELIFGKRLNEFKELLLNEKVIEMYPESSLNDIFLDTCGFGTPEMIELLYDKVNPEFIRRWSVIEAAYRNNLITAKYLIDKGGDINAVHYNNGYTALHYAAEYKCLDLIKLLVSKGAKKLIYNDEGLTPYGIVYKNKCEHFRYIDSKEINYNEILKELE